MLPEKVKAKIIVIYEIVRAKIICYYEKVRAKQLEHQ